MEKIRKIWLNGQLVPFKEAKIHVLSHALHYGTGVFEGIRFYQMARDSLLPPGQSAVFRLKDHLKRLFYSASALAMKIPFTSQELEKAVLLTIRKNRLKEGYIRPIIFFGQKHLGLNPKGNPVQVAITVWAWKEYLGAKSIRLKTTRYIRIHPKSTVTDAKICGHYVNSALASIEARGASFDEALFLDYRGKVAEAPGENIFMVKNGILYTPKLGNILAGITRDTVITLARDLGYPVKEKDLTPSYLKSADEVFLTGTAAEIAPVYQIDQTRIKEKLGPFTRKLQKLFSRVVRGKEKKYLGWLTFI